MSLTASYIVGEMADLIRREGWIQHKSRSPEGRCLVGAYQEVLNELPIEIGNAEVFMAALTAIHQQIQEVSPKRMPVQLVQVSLGEETTMAFSTLPVYNDANGRTVDEITNVLDKARIGLEEKGL